MTAAKWLSRKRVETLVVLKQKHRSIGVSREKVVEAHRKNAAVKKVMVRSTLQRIGGMLDLFNEEVREDVSMGGIVDAMASVLSESDLAGIMTQNSMKVKRRTDSLAEVQKQITQLQQQIESMSEKGEISTKHSAWFQNQLTNLEHRLWANELLVYK